MNGLVSIIIPSRNEKYLQNTILDLLSRAKDDVEIIVILDGYWPDIGQFVHDKRVSYIHFSKALGMRNAINSGIAVAKGGFILKTDAHCMYDEAYDRFLKDSCPENYVVVPRRFALDPEKWQVINNPKYPVDYMYLSKELHGVIWDEKNKDWSLQEKKIDDLMSAQGSCWFMRKDYYNYLELEDEESYGRFYNEFQEIGFKAWLSGGRVIVNKKTWYAHWHKTGDVGRGYSLGRGEQEKAVSMVEKWRTGKVWHKQIHDLNWLIEKFKPVPTW